MKTSLDNMEKKIIVLEVQVKRLQEVVADLIQLIGPMYIDNEYYSLNSQLQENTVNFGKEHKK